MKDKMKLKAILSEAHTIRNLAAECLREDDAAGFKRYVHELQLIAKKAERAIKE